MGSPYRFIKKLCVILVCSAGGSTASYFLYCDLYAVATDGTGHGMGTVKHQVATVKRKPSHSYLWTLTRLGQTVFRRDSILVGPESSAALSLQDGGTLEIGENSLIVVDDLKNVSLNYMRGAFVVRSDKGDKTLEADGTGKVKSRKIVARLLFPPPHARQHVVTEATGKEAAGKVLFRWEPVKKEVLESKAALVLDVSNNASFAGPSTRSYPVADGAARLGVDLTPGKYYWRLSQENTPLTETRVVRVAETPSIKPVWPPAGHNVEQWGDAGTIQFRWVPPPQTDDGVAAWVVVARDSAFKDVVLKEPVAPDTGMLRLNGLPEGELFWRFDSKWGDREVSSRPLPFRVKRVSLLPLELKGGESAKAAPLPERHRFSWDFEVSDADFEIVVEKKTGEGFVPVFSETSRARSAAWQKPISGTFRWQVTARRNGEVMGKSDWRLFSFFDGKPITLKSPAPKSAIQYWETPASVEFSWDPVASGAAKDYIIELASDFQFKNIVATPRAAGPPFTPPDLKLSPGTYFWRVRLVDSAEQTLRLSAPSSFDYGPHPTLAAPGSARPKSGTVISVLQSEGDPSLEWDAVPEAAGYEITLRAPKTNAAFSETVKENTFVLKGLSAGRYLWTVRTVDRIGRKGEEMPWRELTLHYGPLPAPKSVISEVQ